MPLPPNFRLPVAEAHRVLLDPVLCAANPNLRRLAFYVASTARGLPAIQMHRPANSTPGDAA